MKTAKNKVEFKKLPNELKNQEIFINPLELAENYFFHQNNKQKDYRKSAIEYCIENRLNFNSTFNSVCELTDNIKITCPKCKKNTIKDTSSGGSGNFYGFKYECKHCNIVIHFSINPNDFLVIDFK